MLSILKKIDVLISHSHEDRRSLDHQANVNSQEVT